MNTKIFNPYVLLIGQLLLAKGEIEQAFAAFKIVLEGDRDNVPALLGQVYLVLCFSLMFIIMLVVRYCKLHCT